MAVLNMSRFSYRCGIALRMWRLGGVAATARSRRTGKTRIELSSALFEYLEIFHNRNRRHSSLGMLTPIEYEKVNSQTANAA